MTPAGARPSARTCIPPAPICMPMPSCFSALAVEAPTSITRQADTNSPNRFNVFRPPISLVGCRSARRSRNRDSSTIPNNACSGTVNSSQYVPGCATAKVDSLSTMASTPCSVVRTLSVTNLAADLVAAGAGSGHYALFAQGDLGGIVTNSGKSIRESAT